MKNDKLVRIFDLNRYFAS